MIIEINKAFNHIHYFDDGHYYVNIETGQKLTSVTTYKKKYQHPFEGKTYDFWLNKKAVEAGLTADEMQDQWDEARIVGVTRGSRIHDYAEQLTLRKHMNLELSIDHMAKLKRQVHQYFNDYPNLLNIATELVIGNELLGGQIDRLVWDTETEGVYIVDYKTDNKDEAGLEKAYKKMKKPLTHLEDSIINGYYVQVNLYREIMEEAGFPIMGMKIVHFRSCCDEYKIYDVPVINILNNDD